MKNAVILEYNKDLLWESDWDGEDVGYDDIDVVGLYKLNGTNTYFYIDMENNKVLEAFNFYDEDDFFE